MEDSLSGFVISPGIEELVKISQKFEHFLEDKRKSDEREEEEKRVRRRRMEAYRTEMCRQYLAIGFCRYGGKCRFAHNHEQLQTRALPLNYKTRLCRNFEKNRYCIYGAKCMFVHLGESSHMQYVNNGFHQQLQLMHPFVTSSPPIMFVSANSNVQMMHFHQSHSNNIIHHNSLPFFSSHFDIGGTHRQRQQNWECSDSQTSNSDNNNFGQSSSSSAIKSA